MVGIRKNKMISVGTEQGQWRSGWIDPTCLWGSSLACSVRWEGWSSGIRGGRWWSCCSGWLLVWRWRYLLWWVGEAEEVDTKVATITLMGRAHSFNHSTWPPWPSTKDATGATSLNCSTAILVVNKEDIEPIIICDCCVEISRFLWFSFDVYFRYADLQRLLHRNWERRKSMQVWEGALLLYYLLLLWHKEP